MMMREFLRKVKRRLKVFDMEHNKILSRNKIFIAIMGLAVTIVLVTVLSLGIVKIVQNSKKNEPSGNPPALRTRWPEEEVMAQVDDVTPTPSVTNEPAVTATPIPTITPTPVPTVTPSPDPIVESIEKPEDVVVKDTVMKEEDKKDDGKNNSNKGNNSNNTSLIQKEDNSKYVENATSNTYTDNGFYTKNGLKYYAKDGVTISKVGIDVSIYQRDIDWKKVKASGVDFVMIRLGFRGYITGKLMLDANFKKNIDGALDAGLDVGIYFFSQAVTTREAVEEATMCIKYLEPYKGRITYPIAIDTEYVDSASARTNKPSVTNKVRTDVCIAFCETIKSAGYKPMVYANKYWLLNNLQLSRLNNYDIWYAKYGGSTPSYDHDFTIWQYTGSGRINGIVGDVDLNVGLKDYSASGQAGKPQETPKPETSQKPNESEGSEQPQGTISPDGSEEPQGTISPGGSEETQGTIGPDGSKEPGETPEPGNTNNPQNTVSPNGSKEPQGTVGPDGSKEPDGTQRPGDTNNPQDTVSPNGSKEPQGTMEPDGSKAPENTKGPQNTLEPGDTKEPQNTPSPEESKEPQLSESPDNTKEPDNSKAPEASKEPTETKKPEETKEPVVSDKPENSAGPEETREPAEDKTPEPTSEPETGKEPEDNVTPESGI